MDGMKNQGLQPEKDQHMDGAKIIEAEKTKKEAILKLHLFFRRVRGCEWSCIDGMLTSRSILLSRQWFARN